MAAADVLKKPTVAPPEPPALPSGGDVRTLELRGHVGFDSLPQQLVQKAKAAGFTFNVLCVGETGIGKSTLMESLFDMALGFPNCNNELSTVQLNENTFDVHEGDVNVKLSIVETAGFGDQLDKEGSSKVISDYLNQQYEKYLQEELKIRRCLQLYRDTRIHACIYFIPPTGHGLKALDSRTLTELSKIVNVIPVIAKCDTSSKEELKRFKSKIMSDLRNLGVELYRFPEDDDTVRDVNHQLNAIMPFAVVGSTDFVMRGGKKIRARQYPWGIVEVENEEHCDFIKLREALLRTNIEDLRERTHRVHYEAYRRRRLKELGIRETDTGLNLAQTISNRMENQSQELKQMDEKIREQFTTRVNEKDKELHQQQEEMDSRYGERERLLREELKSVEELIRKTDAEFQFLQQRKVQEMTLQSSGGKGKKK